MANRVFLSANKSLYAAARPLIFRGSAQIAHERILSLLHELDNHRWAHRFLTNIQRTAFEQQPVEVGGVLLDFPLMLAAGFVKGMGFASEEEALNAVDKGQNIIPGWRSMPALVGAVEFGSFTRWPRLGNPGTVIWRDASTRSTQNCVGLRNPGARAAATFLAQHKADLPRLFGINIAVSPGVSDPTQTQDEALQALDAFISQGVHPAWITLNLSCPNTEDDPGGHQTEEHTRSLCGVAAAHISNYAPLWVKISPDLSTEQYAVLMRVFEEVGVRGVIATNTLAQPAPTNPDMMAGVGGGRLHSQAVAAAAALMHEKTRHRYTVDIIGCGGVQDAATYQDFIRLGVQAVQYWTALIYRGPLVAALIMNEAKYA